MKIANNTRFSLWSGKNRPIGQFMYKDGRFVEVIQHSYNGRDLHYESIEETNFDEDFVEDLHWIIQDGGGRIGTTYVNVFSPRPLENEWIAKALEMLESRLVDKGFNVLNNWLGYYDEYCLHYKPSGYGAWGTLEIHSKNKVFNPQKYCGGEGYKYEKLGETTYTDKQWLLIKKAIVSNGRKVGDKKVCFDNPYPTSPVEFIDGSDVPISGYYE